MRLYHFTAARYVEPILRDGINVGAVLVDPRTLELDRRYRWLTTSPSWDQVWAEGTGRLPYRRDEARLTVDVPDHKAGSVLRWDVSGPILSRAYDLLSGYGDPQNWRLYRGDVPAAWITAVDLNPALVPAHEAAT